MKIEPIMNVGDFVICFQDCGWYGRGTWHEDIASLSRGTVNDWHPHELAVLRVDRVMPQTFEGAAFIESRQDFADSRRRYRSGVIHSARTIAEAVALRDAILAIGRDADSAIEAELGPKAQVIEAKHRSRALKKLLVLLPHAKGSAA